MMGRFVSEAIQPVEARYEVGAMSRGEPGLPEAFSWQGRRWQVMHKLMQWKDTSPEGGKADGEVYLRRHYYQLLMSDGSVWTVYFLRQSTSTVARWFLYTIDDSGIAGES